MARAQRAAGSQPSDSPDFRVNYVPQGDTLRLFHRHGELVRILIGPLGSGKTRAALQEILRLCHTQTPDAENRRRNRWCIARNSFPDLNATTIPDAREILDVMNPDGWNMTAPITWNHTYKRKDGTTVEIELVFRSFDGDEDVKKARGMQLTGVWVDELAEFHKANWDMLIGRVKRYPAKAHVPDAKFDVLGTSNACPKDSWLGKIATGPKQPNWWIGIQPGGVIHRGNKWVENPHAENLQNLPKNYYLDQCTNKKESWIRQNLANEFVHHTSGRPVHPDFSERLHVEEVEFTYGLPIHVGIDFGRTPAAVIGQRQINGQWYIRRELVTRNTGADRFGRILRTLINDEFDHFDIGEITGDPAGSDMAQTRDETPFMMLEASDLYAVAADTNDPEIRIGSLDKLLTEIIEGQPAILIHPECETLIAGLAGKYQFRRVHVANREEYRDKPDKGPESHVCEALHYMLLGAGEGDSVVGSTVDAEFDSVENWSHPDHWYE